MAELNDLLRQAASLCDDLAEVVDDADDQVEALVAAGNTLDEGLDNEVGDLREALQALTGKIQTAKSELDSSRGTTVSALDQLTGRAEAVTGDTDVLVNAGKEGTSHVEDALAQVGQMLDQQAGLLTGDFQRLGEALTDLSEATSDHVEEAQQQLTAFTQRLDAADEDLDNHREAWLKAVDALTDEMTEQTKDSVEGMADLLRAQGTALVHLGNALVTAHNETLEKIDARFREESVKSLTERVDPLLQELGEVVELASRRKGEMSEKAGAIVTRFESLIPEILELTDQLRSSEQLE